MKPIFKSHNSRGFFICFAVTVLVLAVYLLNGFDALELKTVDFRFQYRGNRPVNSDIVVVTVDEESIAKLGRWPWPRSTHARLIRSLKKAGATVVAFDTLFTEVDRENPGSDSALASASKEAGNVVSAFFFKQVDHSVLGKDPLFPYEKLLESGPIGYVNLEPDRDGVTRRAPLVLFEEGSDQGKLNVYPSISVMALALSRGRTMEQLFGELPIRVDQNDIHLSKNDLFINFAFDRTSPTGFAYPTYSYADVLDSKLDLPSHFGGKIVLVGATAAALFDLKAIPYVPIHPGVMVHANVLDNLISGQFMREVSPDMTVLYVILLGVLLGIFLPRLRPWAKLGVFAAVLFGGLAAAVWSFNHYQWVIPVVPPLFAAVGCYGGISFYRLVVEEREKRKIKGSFRQYLSPKIIDVITKDPSKLKLGGEEREVSIFFLDIAGFTTMSEALKPSQLVEVMNNCLTEFSNIILKHDGLINKYIGDCIMAFWNAPADQKRHAAQACLAGLDCISVLPDINRRFQEKGLPAIDCRIGINTGIVVVGNMGSSERFDYTVMGDPVNLASRLEGANKQYHTHIMISDVTFEKAKDEIEARDLDLIRVKGKKEPRKVFEVLSKKAGFSDEMREARERYHRGLSSFRQRAFDDAIEAFDSVFEYWPNDHVSRLYLERARLFKNHPPPPTWDGVYEMLTK